MKNLLLILVFLFLISCNKPKTVLICGDHICVNKAEAEQFFEENLTLEVQIIDKRKSDEINLIELNLNKDPDGKKQITLAKKENTNNKLKELSKSEIKKKKIAIKNRNKVINKKVKKEIKSEDKLQKISKKQDAKDSKNKVIKTVNKPTKKQTDICKILQDCSINEISKYLVKQGMDRDFPDITVRGN